MRARDGVAGQLARAFGGWSVAAAVALLVGACGGGEVTNQSGADTGGTTCTPSCGAAQCGDDGCGGVCGVCGAGLSCALRQCVEIPDTVGGDGASPDTDTTPSGPTDLDQDSVFDNVDNCPQVFNPDQRDSDGDHRGDPCDNDRDGDGDENLLDCEPDNPYVGPSAPERCGDAVDNDCDGATDEEGAVDCEDFFQDNDGDGAGLPETRLCLCAPLPGYEVRVGGDCNDANAAVSPLVGETCDDLDNNCNLLVDEGCDDDGDGFCDAALPIVGTPAICPKGGGDCYDYSALVSPEQEEVLNDGLDNDCDGVAQGDNGGSPLPPTCDGACTGSTVDAVLCAMEICYPGYVTGSSITSPTGDGISGYWTAMNRWGSTINGLAPREGGSYAVLGSGRWNDTNHNAYPSGAFGGPPDPYSSSGEDMYDAVELKVTMRAPPGATGFTLDYIFLSAEYEEFIGSEFNDKFYIVLKAPQTTQNQPTIINYTHCSHPNQYHDFLLEGEAWCYIAINTAFSEPCANVTTNIAGTGHQCPFGSSTGWLSTSWPIQAGEQFELIFHIHDTSDDAWYSLVILDNFRWEGGSFEAGTISHH